MVVGIRVKTLFEANINNTINALRAKNYVAAEEFIKYAMVEDYHAPEVQNLMGILAELTGDLSLAGKHYRAAYALNPAYRPASNNHERITSFWYSNKNTNIDDGDKPEEEQI